MNAVGLLALWELMVGTWHVREEDRRAIGRLRLNQLLALPGAERDHLIGLVWDLPIATVVGGHPRQRGTKQWQH